MTNETGSTPGGETTERLFDMFAPASYDAWRAAAEKTLKGVAFEKKLITRTYEGIDLQPIYTAADTASLPHTDSLPGQAPFIRGTSPLGYALQPWAVAQELPYPTVAAVNEAARFDLQRGLTTLHVPLDRATALGQDPDQAPAASVGNGGASLATVEDAVALLNGISLTGMPLLLPAASSALQVAALVVAAATRQGVQPNQLQGCIGADPLGTLAAYGSLPASLAQSYDAMAALTRWATGNAPQLRTILVQTYAFNNGGASAVQELAFALATGVDYLRAMQERGLDVNTVAPRMQFACSIGAPFFMEIARLRAARLLWGRVVAAFGGDAAAQKLYLHARTSSWTKTRTDGHNNMLRASSEAFAAVMGGCDSLHISPFDEAVGLPDEFSRRIARNVHVILQEECNFYRLVDPAGGAWYIEKLTDEVARKAWELFQEIERQGGMAAALSAGWPQEQVAATRGERLNQIAMRRDVIIGVNMFANLKEHPFEARVVDNQGLQTERSTALERQRAAGVAQVRQAALDALATAVKETPEKVVPSAIAAAEAGATLGELTGVLTAGAGAAPRVAPLPAHRGAEQFETLRLHMDQYAQRSGDRLAVFLANMGPVAQHKARADFATGFFTAGGFDVITNLGFATVEEAAQAAHDSGAPIVVICSTDDTYPELVPALVPLLKRDRPDTSIVLAGYPTDQIDALRAAGVDEFIHLRANCYATLERLQRLKGVAP